MNEHIVTGCRDCPLWWEAEGNRVCEHPKAPTRFGIWENGEFTELPFKLPVGLYRLETESGAYSLSVSEEQYEVEDDEDFNPITPEWCPLNQSSITIIKKE